MTHDPIAYTYEAAHHCPDCTEARFGRSEAGFIAESATDDEGNDVGALFTWDEWWNVGEEGCDILACDDCRAVIAKAHAFNCERDGGDVPCTIREEYRV